jgi:hypothetical protein
MMKRKKNWFCCREAKSIIQSDFNSMTFQTERKLILTKDPTVDISNQSQKKKKF